MCQAETAGCIGPHALQQGACCSCCSYACEGLTVHHFLQAAVPRKRGRGRPAGSKTRVRSDKERLPSTPAGAPGLGSAPGLLFTLTGSCTRQLSTKLQPGQQGSSTAGVLIVWRRFSAESHDE